MLKHFHFATILFLVAYNALLFVAHSQDQSGFISLDCGLPENSSYTEKTTEIIYVSDAAFVDGGESKSVSPDTQQPITTLRSFPQGTRNCYTVNTRRDTKYLIRTSFLYGNYDGKNKTPEFDLHLGPNFWDTVRFEDMSVAVIKEVIHLPGRSFVHVCLVNTGSGTPFINALELRPLGNTTYEAGPEFSFALVFRRDIGSSTKNSYRYPFDVFDRLWTPYVYPELKNLETSETVDRRGSILFRPPRIVMNNAGTPVNASMPFQLELFSDDEYNEYYIYFHFAEIQNLEANESRVFNIHINRQRPWAGPIRPRYLVSNTIYSGTPLAGAMNYTITFEKLENSTLPPILNAIEVYMAVDLLKLETEEKDVDAMMNIKSFYGVKRNWGGDPCLPVKYLWTGLNCSINGVNPPRITSLDLSSSGLTGEIPIHIADLNKLESLDLSNNKLTGPVPDFLSHYLPNLRVLNLAKNKLTGVVPPELIERSKAGFLSLSVEENQDLCVSSPCKKKKQRNVVVPIVASVVGSFIVLAIAVAIFVGLVKKKKQGSNLQMGSFKSRKRKFTYSEIVKITKNFDRILGKGGFATVYYGVLDDGTEVAVKKIRIQSGNGNEVQSQNNVNRRRKKDEAEEQYRQYQAEVKLLLTVYHGNLTSLVGYCNQGINRVLIYEYMANGDLESYISGKQSKILSWETRLQIAIDSAQGLEYLHSGCKLSIIHRDIKAANILITENYRAKLADFGLSKFFLTEDGTHVSTMHIAGTPGYIDPELANNGLLKEKSDVYSFGVVLLQIITGRPTISRDSEGERVHISDWVSLMLDSNNIKSMVDKRLHGDFEINSVWKAVEIAMACVSAMATNRPNMMKVVTELRECLVLEQAQKTNHGSRDSSAEMLSINHY